MKKFTTTAGSVLLLLVFSAAIAIAAPPATDSPDTLDLEAMRLNAEKYKDIQDFEIQMTMSVSMSGISLDINHLSRVLAPDYAYVEMTVPMQGSVRLLCDGDSLWTFTESSHSYYAEPWTAWTDQETGGTMEQDLSSMLSGGVPSLSFLYMLLCNELEGRYVSGGTEKLQLDGQSTLCEVWHLDPEPSSGSETTLWVNAATGIVRRTQVVDKAGTAQAQNASIELSSLKTDTGLTPDDFRFVPVEGFHRVDGPGERFVSKPMKGKTMAGFELRDLSGERVNSDDWRGRFVVLDFWATWCGPCRKTLPHLQKLAREYGDRIQVIGLTSEKAATVQAFFAKTPSPYPILIDSNGEVSGTYGVESLPTLFVLDPQGKIVAQVVGAQSESELRTMIDRVLQD